MHKLKLFLLLVLMANLLPVQSLNLKVVPQKGVISVKGTSTLHDWEMKLNDLQSTCAINPMADGGYEIAETRLSFKAENLKSGNSGLDDKAYEALKTEKHPTITFAQTEKITIQPGQQKFKTKVRGTLTVGGSAKPVELEVDGEQLQDGSFRVTGKKLVKMTDFGIEPPRAMFGTIRSGDAVTIEFDVTFR
jgi:polyisoprenoid-binding protein YceI